MIPYRPITRWDYVRGTLILLGPLILIILLLLLFGCSARADELPATLPFTSAPPKSKPRPKMPPIAPVQHRDPILRAFHPDTSWWARAHWTATALDYASTGLATRDCLGLSYPRTYLLQHCGEADPLARPFLGRHTPSWRLGLSWAGESALVSLIPNRRVRRITQIALIGSHLGCAAWNFKNWH